MLGLDSSGGGMFIATVKNFSGGRETVEPRVGESIKAVV